MLITEIPYYKRLLSYLYPVRIWRGGSVHNPILELFLHQGRYQLATSDAVYSDSDRYRPLQIAFDNVGGQLGKIKSVLVLGAGLGSAVDLFRVKKYFPDFTLVDNDEVIIGLAQQILSHQNNIQYVQADVQEFVQHIRQKYDMVVVDTFINRVVPEFITSVDFLDKCSERINDGGHFVLNYIINDNDEWQEVLQNIQAVFPVHKVLKEGINRIIVARV